MALLLLMVPLHSENLKFFSVRLVDAGAIVLNSSCLHTVVM